MNECSGFIGHFFGHKYSARYDEVMPGVKLKNFNIGMINAIKEINYRGDVCSRCGDIVNNEEQK